MREKSYQLFLPMKPKGKRKRDTSPETKTKTRAKRKALRNVYQMKGGNLTKRLREALPEE